MEESTEQTRPPAQESSPAGGWTLLLAGAGVAAVIGGGLLAMGPRVGAELGWIAESFARIGIESGVVLSSGVISLGLALLNHRAQQVNEKLEAAQKTVERTEFVSLAMGQLAERMSVIHADICELKNSHAATLAIVQEQSETETTGMQVDATFHLASSMDKLGRDVAIRLEEQADSVQAKFEEVTDAISNNQEQLRTLLEERVEEPEESWPAFEDSPLDAEPVLFSVEDDEQDEIELEVDLEGAEESPQSKTDVSSFDWEGVEIPEEHRHTDLGLLDELVELDGAPCAPLPSEDELPAQDDGLGLLDELSDDGRLLGAESAPAPPLPLGPGIPLHDPGQPRGFDNKELEQAWDAFKEADKE